MAVKTVSIVDVPLNEVKAITFNTATSTTDGFEVSYTGADNRTAFIVNASAAGTLTFKAGNAIQGAEDITMSVAEGYSVIWMDSGLIKNVLGGSTKGKVYVIPSATTVTLAVAHLGRITGETITY